MPTHRKPSRSLPSKPSVEYLRKEAKRFSKARSINLVAAQRALAHEYGHRNWPELMTAAKTVLQPAHTPSRSNVKSSESSEAPQLHDEEWSAILNLAEVSLGEVQIAPSMKDMKEWLDNRKAFPESAGIQQHFVATTGKQIVGYACAEHPAAWMRNKKDAPGEYRLFVVVEPSARSTLGIRLLAKLVEFLGSVGARRAWFQEYEADAGLLSFLEERGFVRAASFRIEDGTRIVRLSMDAPFESLMQ
ncbi:MAG TPA: GNAT family N-acetyltransferase [Candidatus Binatus sp.]|nr:GNAT family N-acetyltransferase [Candidatus Binatus sp.]